MLLGLHDFRGALAVAERARAVEPEDWWNYGTLADAHVELGDYAHALKAAQRMVDLRPGLPSYARAAFLRALFGDRAGAIELLRLAVAAGSAREPEGRAWALVHLGHSTSPRGTSRRRGAPTPGRSTSFRNTTWRSAASDAYAPPKGSSPRRATSTAGRWRACRRPT